MPTAAVSAAVGILCARGHVRSRNGPGAEVEHESAEKVIVRLLPEPIAATPFAATTLDVRSISSADWRSKVVLVNFWATWCPPCRAEMPDLDALYNKFKDHGLVVLAISDEEAAKVSPFISERKISYPVLLDPGRKVNDLFIVEGIPKSFVYDRSGRMVAQSIDMRTRDQFLGMLAQAGLQ